MKDITTGIHEYGYDRMTPQDTIVSCNKSIKTHGITIVKYLKWYVLNPKSFLIRLKSLLRVILILLKGKIKNVTN